MSEKVDVSQFDTAQIVADDKRHFHHPFQLIDLMREEGEGALPFFKADGCYLWDTNGNKYFDAVGGMWCTNVGASREEIARVMYEETMKASYINPFVDMTHPSGVALAKKLAELTPGDLNHTLFTVSGSTATDDAYRLAVAYHRCRDNFNKTQVLSRNKAFHGSTFLTQSFCGKANEKPEYFNFLTDMVHFVSAPNSYREGAGKTPEEFKAELLQEFEDKILEVGADNIACHYAEPVYGGGGCFVPPEGYHKGIIDLCHKYDILYISDEVVTAFGRLGHFFASEDRFGIVPDIITAAKGLTSGYIPMGACIFSDRIYDVLASEEGRFTIVGSTYTAHPVAAAVALKNIEIIERENLLEHVLEIGPYFQKQLNTLKDLDIVGDVRGSHFMQCVEFVKNKESKEIFPDEFDIGKRVSLHADSLGLIVRPLINLNIMSPALTMTKEEVDFVVSALRKAIELTQDDLREMGEL
ncbi:Adenosylmethionine-8-amino-7-oxononanoate aminotransferase [Microbulbifer donghaiensis]|uniref:Adenosylmethionine-8-amino-7-oxononanoate aminotransferase n=1 Tax=Microbulbifer donghaiensis TaxID=494016 RepID=A0A1M4WTL0_9GAMM|nr:aminotransferase class III-fold pyridoxal phosphate-dependent enzyme [Microbulbifer donghaiensis]SHE84535.1 Adenosylmethionine-8-amino-7-oxononanoate aminotransferase [Microbulbifer donghaiensis]